MISVELTKIKQDAFCHLELERGWQWRLGQKCIFAADRQGLMVFFTYVFLHTFCSSVYIFYEEAAEDNLSRFIFKRVLIKGTFMRARALFYNNKVAHTQHIQQCVSQHTFQWWPGSLYSSQWKLTNWDMIYLLVTPLMHLISDEDIFTTAFVA